MKDPRADLSSVELWHFVVSGFESRGGLVSVHFVRAGVGRVCNRGGGVVDIFGFS